MQSDTQIQKFVQGEKFQIFFCFSFFNILGISQWVDIKFYECVQQVSVQLRGAAIQQSDFYLYAIDSHRLHSNTDNS